MAEATQQWEAQEAAYDALIGLLEINAMIATGQSQGFNETEVAHKFKARLKHWKFQPVPPRSQLSLQIYAREYSYGGQSSTSTSTPTELPANTPEPTATPTNTTTPQPSATPLPTLTPTLISIPQFRDTFDTDFQPEWILEEDDEWAIVNGQLTSLSSNDFLNSLDETLRLGDETWANYRIELDFIRAPTIAHPCYLGFLITQENDELRYLHLWMSGTFAQVGRNGLFDSLTDGRIPDLQPPCKVRVEALGSLITLFIDDEQVYQSNVPGYKRGYVGLSCESDGALIDNFIVTPLEN